jgi:hypothetical protein
VTDGVISGHPAGDSAECERRWGLDLGGEREKQERIFNEGKKRKRIESD